MRVGVAQVAHPQQVVLGHAVALARRRDLAAGRGRNASAGASAITSMRSRATRISAATSSATARVGQISRAARSIASLRIPPRSPARSDDPACFWLTRSWTVTTIGTRGCSSAPFIHGAWKTSSPRRGWRPSTTSPPWLLGDRAQPVEQAARVAADAARIRRRP